MLRAASPLDRRWRKPRDAGCGDLARAGRYGFFLQSRICAGRRRSRQNCVRKPVLLLPYDGGGQERICPSLAGVVGRRAGTAPGYKYTDAMANSGLTWDQKTLDSFLTSTTAKVPGTAMAVALPNASERAAIIGYLETLGVTISAQAQAPAAVELPPPAPGHAGRAESRSLRHQNWMYASKDYSGQRFVNLARSTRRMRTSCGRSA